MPEEDKRPEELSEEEELDEGEVEDEVEESPRRPEPVGPPPRTLVEKAWALQHRMGRGVESLTRGRIARVLRMARKPEADEFRQSAMIVLVGIAIIGGIGFFIFFVMDGLLRFLTQKTT